MEKGQRRTARPQVAGGSDRRGLVADGLGALDQLPFLLSAAAMLAGLYVLAGPFREDRSDIFRLLPVWGVLHLYEFLVIGMIAVLRRRGGVPQALTAVSLLFLADVLFFGDAFASTDLEIGLRCNLAGLVLGLTKAGFLARAQGFTPTPWQAGWVVGALGFIHLFPTLIAFPAALPADYSLLFGLGICVASVLAVPLVRYGRLGGAFVAGMALHVVATGLVGSMDFHAEFLTPVFLAVACSLPRPKWVWIPFSGAFLTSPLRTAAGFLATADGIGILLVAASFVTLLVGFLGYLRRNPREPDERAPEQAVRTRPSKGRNPAAGVGNPESGGR